MKKIFQNAAVKGTLFLLLTICGAEIKAQHIKASSTFANPLNLSYRFQLTMPSRREAADPAVVFFKGKYLLFLSKSGGYWWSNDLLQWNFVTSPDLPLEDYAPAAVVIKDTVYFMALNKHIYKSGDPLSGRWQVAKKDFPIYAGDPDLFLDDDGRLYLYYGLSPLTPIYGVELDRNTFDPLGKPIPLFNTDAKNYGWEVTGDYNTLKKKAYLEGAWMTKHQGKYYLQYAVPGTQYKSYCDGLYTSESPLGPYKLADNNPFSYKPEGFIAGAGHSSTFGDKYGNFWHMVTMTISVKEKFERRIGLFPAFFDREGVFYTYTGFGDFPHAVPERKMKGPDDYLPTWMLLSYHKPVEASSEFQGHPKENIADENVRTYWSAGSAKKGEWVMTDLQKPCTVSAVQVNFAEEDIKVLGRSDTLYHQYLLEYSTDKKSWKVFADKSLNRADVPHDYIAVNTPVTARYIKLTNVHTPGGKFAVSDLRVFGNGKGKPPHRMSSFTALRDTDARKVILKWKKDPKAVGYNIRYGTQMGKLYENYQVMNSDTLAIRSLNRLKDYYFTIDVFNENGITKGSLIQKINSPQK